MENVKIVTKPGFTVVGMGIKEQVTPETIPHLWNQFLPRVKEIENKSEPSASYGICYHTGNDQFAYIAGFAVSDSEKIPEGMEKMTIPEQKYAVFTHKGTADKIHLTMKKIYKWLPEAGLEPAKLELERYDERFQGPMNEDSELDLYVAVK